MGDLTFGDFERDGYMDVQGAQSVEVEIIYSGAYGHQHAGADITAAFWPVKRRPWWRRVLDYFGVR